MIMHSLSESRWEVIKLCVHVSRIAGVPKSVCEIFGFVFTSPHPVTFEEIVEGLGMSNGSASHGLRYLRRIGALSITYQARDRRDYYVPEVSLGRLASGYLLENVTLHLGDSRERICALRDSLAAKGNDSHRLLSSRLQILLDWNCQVTTAIAVATNAFASRELNREALDVASHEE